MTDFTGVLIMGGFAIAIVIIYFALMKMSSMESDKND
jgi:hypothetical protein